MGKKGKKKVIAVASFGGHWMQLLRIVTPLEKNYDVSYVCTNEKCSSWVPDRPFYCVTDFSRWNAWKVFFVFFRALWILLKERPDVAVSTGAAPGLIFLLISKYVFFRDTIWIDSFANAEKLSYCGRLAVFFRINHIYTQWEHLSGSNVKYSGNILG